MKFCIGLLVIFACPTDKPIAISEFCQVSSLIRVEKGESKRLSFETNKQIAKHNRKYHQLCDKPTHGK